MLEHVDWFTIWMSVSISCIYIHSYKCMLSNDHISALDENLKKVGTVSGHMEFAATHWPQNHWEIERLLRPEWPTSNPTGGDTLEFPQISTHVLVNVNSLNNQIPQYANVPPPEAWSKSHRHLPFPIPVPPWDSPAASPTYSPSFLRSLRISSKKHFWFSYQGASPNLHYYSCRAALVITPGPPSTHHHHPSRRQFSIRMKACWICLLAVP